jgi:hypothetical protein
MARMRKFRDDDCRLLGELIRDMGRLWVFRLLGLWIGNNQPVHWKNRLLAFGIGPQRFMRNLLTDYTADTVLDAIKNTPKAKGKKVLVPA